VKLTLSNLPKSALTPDEHEDRAIERSPRAPRDLECAAVEPDGTLIAWSAQGYAVEIGAEDRHAVVSLLLQGQIQHTHLHALIRAITVPQAASDPKHRKALLDLFRQLVVYLPPEGYREAVSAWDVMAATRIAIAGVPCEEPVALAPEMHIPPALLLTINRAGVITSCTGTALTYIKTALPDLTTAGTVTIDTMFGGPDSPTRAAYTRALRGEPWAYRATFAGADWAVQIEPLRDTHQVIVGVVAYAALAGSVQTAPPPGEEEAFLITTVSGRIVHYSMPLLRLIGACAPLPAAHAQALQTVVLPLLTDPVAYIERTYQLYASPNAASDVVPLKDGRVLHRYSHPVLNAGGQVRARAWYFNEAVSLQSAHRASA
jgi:hypothetical protein